MRQIGGWTFATILTAAIVAETPHEPGSWLLLTAMALITLFKVKEYRNE